MKTVAEVLRRAVTVLDERGWAQGQFVVETDGRCCVLGALRVAISPKSPLWLKGGQFHVYWAASGHLQAEVGTIPAWNDAKGRTVDEVKAALLAAAERAEATA